jgi:GNAT superfamily N-acetyltransferase
MDELNEGQNLDFQFKHIRKEVIIRKDHTLTEHRIYATLNEKEAGHISFFLCKEKRPNSIESAYITVYKEYRGTKLAYLLLREFGEMYRKHFDGYTVSLVFVNPMAEYMYRKAVSLGWIPESALEGRCIRSYGAYLDTSGMNDDEIEEYNKNRLSWNKLNKRLPEKFRGNNDSGQYFSITDRVL